MLPLNMLPLNMLLLNMLALNRPQARPARAAAPA